MRLDEDGNACPATLGEYRDLCAAIFGETSASVKFLDAKIADQGREEIVIADDSQMRLLLFSLEAGR